MPLGFAFAGQPRRLSPHESKVKNPHPVATKRDKSGATPSVHFSKVFAEFGEEAYDQELLALGGGVYFLVL